MDAQPSSYRHVSGISPRLFPSLGPALLVCMGYIDPGKWAAVVDGGARFGFDLLFVVAACNCIAILCQYLAARVGVVTGKNLGQICSEEYSRSTCILLGVQAELSRVILDLTTLLGIAHGLNLLFGLDLLMSILFSWIIATVFPFLFSLLGKHKGGILLTGLAGSGLILYFLGVLSSQPEFPLVLNGLFPRLRGESACALMSILGSAIMPHNLYLHSFFVQEQRSLNVSINALCHDHLITVLLAFSGIFLVNYVVMLSAATIFHSASLTVLTFQDSLLLLDQIFRVPVAPAAFFLVLFFSSQVTTVTWNDGGQIVLNHLFGIDLPAWIHHIKIKSLTIIPALYCAWSSGAEGIYQMLIFSQVILAMLLPSSVIPLFRVASSRPIMGGYKVSGFVEILALSAFLGMIASNLIFLVEMLFGNGDLSGGSIGWNMGTGLTFPYVILLLTAFASLGLMLWLAATPLNVDIRFRSWDLKKDLIEPTSYKGESELGDFNVEEPTAEEGAVPREPLASHLESSSAAFDFDLPDSITDFEQERCQSTVEDNFGVCLTPEHNFEESASSRENHSEVTSDKDVSVSLSDSSIFQKTEPEDSVGKVEQVDRDVHVSKDDEEVDVWEVEEPPGGNSGSVLSPASDGPPSFKSIGGKTDDTSNGSGSLSRLSGLGRAARRQLAAILDEFWGQLFDFHGQVTQEAKVKKLDVILGLDQKTLSSSSIKADTGSTTYMQNSFSGLDRGSFYPPNPKDFGYYKQQFVPNSLDSSSGFQMGSSSWLSSMQTMDSHVRSPYGSSVDNTEKCYSSLRPPSYLEEKDQPATIHGYQIASYLSRIAAEKHTDPLGFILDSPTSKYASMPMNYGDELNFRTGESEYSAMLNSSMSNSAASINRSQDERLYYGNSSMMAGAGIIGSAAYTKKYHSLPDISGRALPSKNSSLASRNTQWNSPIGPKSSVGRNAYEQLLSSNMSSRKEGGPLAFDELSPSKPYRDVFTLPPTSSGDTRSLWSRQPFEQLGISGKSWASGPDVILHDNILHELETKLLQSFRYCIMRLLKLEGSEWLFRHNGGMDEELIDCVAAREKYSFEAESKEINRVRMGESAYISSGGGVGLGPRSEEAALAQFVRSSVPRCGEGCIWRTGLIISFGVWCIHRVLEMSLMESRPELWGKYTYVLNRLQGILDLAFFKPRPSLAVCFCLQIPTMQGGSCLPQRNGKGAEGRCTTASMLLDLIKGVEGAVSSRKGRTGTAAGDVAFPKGKENLASVLKRYKRRLSNKSAGVQDGSTPASRRAPIPPASPFAS